MLGLLIEHFGDPVPSPRVAVLKTRFGERPLDAKAKGRHACGCEMSGHKGKAPGNA